MRHTARLRAPSRKAPIPDIRGFAQPELRKIERSINAEQRIDAGSEDYNPLHFPVTKRTRYGPKDVLFQDSK